MLPAPSGATISNRPAMCVPGGSVTASGDLSQGPGHGGGCAGHICHNAFAAGTEQLGRHFASPTGAVVPFHGEVARFYHDFGVFEIPPRDPNITVEPKGDYRKTCPTIASPIQKYCPAEQKCQSLPTMTTNW